MNPTDELIPILKKLRLSGVLNSLELRNNQAAEDNLSHIEFLYRLLSDEVERREGKHIQMRLEPPQRPQPRYKSRGLGQTYSE